MLKKGAFALLALFAASALYASQQNFGAGSAAAPWLKLPNSARTAAMGDASVAVAGDVNALSVNPAGLAGLEGQQVALMHNIYVQDSALEHLAYGMGLSPGSGFALGLDYLNFGTVDGYQVAPNNTLVSTGGFNPYGLALNLAYGRVLGPLSAGLNLKAVSQNLGAESSSAFGADLGALWHTGNGLSLGTSLQNLGTQLDGASLPLNFKGGAAYLWRVPGEDGALLLAADFNLPAADAGASSGSLGAEYRAQKLYALRAGYKLAGNGSAGGFSAGAGLSYSLARLDYAFVSEGVLGNSNQISLLVTF